MIELLILVLVVCIAILLMWTRDSFGAILPSVTSSANNTRTNSSMYKTTNQPNNQPNNQPKNQPNNQPTKLHIQSAIKKTNGTKKNVRFARDKKLRIYSKSSGDIVGETIAHTL